MFREGNILQVSPSRECRVLAVPDQYHDLETGDFVSNDLYEDNKENSDSLNMKRDQEIALKPFSPQKMNTNTSKVYWMITTFALPMSSLMILHGQATNFIPCALESISKSTV